MDTKLKAVRAASGNCLSLRRGGCTQTRVGVTWCPEKGSASEYMWKDLLLMGCEEEGLGVGNEPWAERNALSPGLLALGSGDSRVLRYEMPV